MTDEFQGRVQQLKVTTPAEEARRLPTIDEFLERYERTGWVSASEAVGLLRALIEENEKLGRHVDQLLADVNGTDWENDLLVNAPEWLDGDEAQCNLVTKYVRWLEGIRMAAATLMGDYSQQALHVRRGENGSCCNWCGCSWPCPTAELRDALESA